MQSPMKRLYDRQESIFAILWIVLYCAIMLPIRSDLGDNSPASPVALACLCLAAMRFVLGSGLAGKYGLNRWPKDMKPFLWFLPMLVLATGNLWGGVKMAYGGAGQLFAVLTMLLVGFLEELTFRGFLFKMMLAKSPAGLAVIVSAVTFGLGHLINLLSGQGTLETAVQMCFAIAWGFMFTYAFWKSGSLWPCVIVHALVDISSTFSAGSETMSLVYIGATIITSLLYCPLLARLKAPD